MLEKLFYTLGLSISLAVLVSCTKQEENKTLPPSVEEQYQSADQQIGKMLDDLNNQDVPLQRKREILCKTYPEVYKKTVHASSPQTFTESLHRGNPIKRF